jgi:hypothetical protein
MTILEKLQKIQVELKVNKGQRNNFGKYNYRSAEDILEAVKPFETKYKVLFKINDELKEVSDRVFVDSEAKVIDLEVTDRESSILSKAQAIIDFDAKGMQMPQRTGAASSYAKKYALGNLLLIDDTKDADATNNHSKAIKTTLKLGSAEYKNVKAFLDKGGDIAKVKLKYNINQDVLKSLTNA